MSRTVIPTSALDSDFPLDQRTLYNYKSSGRVDWLERRGRLLWIDVQGFNEWAERQGKKFRLPVDHPWAVKMEGGAH